MKTKNKVDIIKSTGPGRNHQFLRIQFKMNAIVFLTFCVLAVAAPSSAQFNLPFDVSDCTAGRLLDPFLAQALKSKHPKKFNAKLDLAKDLAMDAKCRLHSAKLLARHLKNLNTANCDLQNLMYQAQQPGLISPVAIPDQSALLAQMQQQQQLQQQQLQQQQQQQQQQHFATLQIPFDTSRTLTLTPQADSQMSCFSQVSSDPRFQQPTLQLGAQSITSLRPQHTMYPTAVPLQL